MTDSIFKNVGTYLTHDGLNEENDSDNGKYTVVYVH